MLTVRDIKGFSGNDLHRERRKLKLRLDTDGGQEL